MNLGKQFFKQKDRNKNENTDFELKDKNANKKTDYYGRKYAPYSVSMSTLAQTP